MLAPIYLGYPETQAYFLVVGGGGTTTNGGFAGMLLTPWAERERGLQELLPDLQQKLNTVPGIQVFAFNLPSLPGSSGGPPIQFVIKSTADYETLFNVVDQLQAEAQKSGLFIFTDVDLAFETPQYRISIDHKKANQLGIRMADIGTTLSTMLGGNFVNRFSLQGRNYQVIPQVPRDFRLTPDWLQRYTVRTSSGNMVSLATLITISESVQPNSLSQFQQQNAL